MSRKNLKKTGGCGEMEGGCGEMSGGANSGTKYIVKQAELGKDISKSLGVKQGPTMVRLISYLRKKSGSSGSAIQQLEAAKTYFNSHKEEARNEYKKLDANKPIRGKSSKKSSKKIADKKETSTAKPKKKTSKKTTKK